MPKDFPPGGRPITVFLDMGLYVSEDTYVLLIKDFFK